MYFAVLERGFNQGLFTVQEDGSFKPIPDNQNYAIVSYPDGLSVGLTGKKNEIVVRERNYIIYA